MNNRVSQNSFLNFIWFHTLILSFSYIQAALYFVLRLQRGRPTWAPLSSSPPSTGPTPAHPHVRGDAALIFSYTCPSSWHPYLTHVEKLTRIFTLGKEISGGYWGVEVVNSEISESVKALQRWFYYITLLSQTASHCSHWHVPFISVTSSLLITLTQPPYFPGAWPAWTSYVHMQ